MLQMYAEVYVVEVCWTDMCKKYVNKYVAKLCSRYILYMYVAKVCWHRMLLGYVVKVCC